MDEKLTLTFLLTALLVLGLANHIGAVGGEWQLLTAKMIIRQNITDSELVITKPIGVRNTANESANIVIEPQGDVEDFVMDEYNFTLEPNSEKWVNFTATIRKPGKYFQDAIVGFSSGEGAQAIGLASQIIFIIGGESLDTAPDQDNTESNEKPTIDLSNFIIPIIIILIIIAVVVLFYKRR